MDIKKQQESRELRAVITGKVPSKKNRYKIANGRIYLDPEVRDWVEMAAWEFKKQRSPYSVIPWTHQLAVTIRFDCDNRSDIDNMCATIFDALQESGIIENDRQICSLNATKTISSEPKTTVIVFPV